MGTEIEFKIKANRKERKEGAKYAKKTYLTCLCRSEVSIILNKVILFERTSRFSFAQAGHLTYLTI